MNNEELRAEIREGISLILHDDVYCEAQEDREDADWNTIETKATDKLFDYLHSKNVVIQSKDTVIFWHGYFPSIIPLKED